MARMWVLDNLDFRLIGLELTLPVQLEGLGAGVRAQSVTFVAGLVSYF